MRTLVLTLAAIAAAAAATACGGRSATSPVAPSDGPSIGLSVAGGGATTASGQGAEFIIDQTPSFTVHLDPRRGLLSLHARSTLCSGGGVPVVDRRRVFTPSAIDQAILQTTSEAEPVAVYSATSLAEAGLAGTSELVGFNALVDATTFCAFITGPARIAEGTVRRFATASNASFVIHWVGELAGVDGRTYQLTELYQLGADAHDPSNPATFVENGSKILLSPRP